MSAEQRGANGRDWLALSNWPMTGTEVLRMVAKAHHLNPAELKSARTDRRVAWPRQEAMRILHDQNGWSLKRIGRFLGGRHHTTVLYGVRAARERAAYFARASKVARAKTAQSARAI